MKALLLNGSPRQGNTVAALEALKRGFANIPDIEIEQINTNDISVSPCIACNACGMNGPCVFDDDTNDVMDAIAAADVIVFATPVYWWNITAQIKLVIDKMYGRADGFAEMKKKVGIIAIGELGVDNPQYEIIGKHFECICDDLEWDIVFYGKYSALHPGELAQSSDAIAEIEGFWHAV